ncbi:hypothetical protein INR49_015991 [Caranx melampygus]|nr:hypothetical protein INR49_015991 [Caranx melampygus]
MAVSQITPTLFLSGADAPLNAALVSQKGITLIVNATLSHACPAYRGWSVCVFPSPTCPPPASETTSTVAGGTLVHCAAGMSRSPALVMAYLMRYRGVTLRQAHRWVQDSRPYVRLNAGFWDQLLQYERRLYGRNTVKVVPVDETPPPLTQRALSVQTPWQQGTWLTLVPRSPLMSRATGSPLMTRAQATTSVNRFTRGARRSRKV